MLLSAAAAAIFVVGTTVRQVFIDAHPLPYWDQWDFLDALERYFAGQYSLLDLWAQHNEHRILFPRLLFFADALWFGATNRFLVSVALTLQGVHAWLLYRLARATGAGPSPLLAATAAICLFHASQIWNFVWGFQVQFVLVYLSCTAAFFALARHLETRAIRWLLACLLAGFVAIGSMANGLFVWPFLVSLAVQLRAPARTIVTLTAVGALAVAAYLIDYQTPGPNLGPLHALRRPFALVVHLLAFFGSPAWGTGEGRAITVGTLTLVVILVTLARRLRVWREQRPSEAVLLHVLLFVLCTGALAASGRVHLPIEDVATSRYATPVLMAWAAVAILLVGDRMVRRRWWRTGGVVLLLVVLTWSEIDYRRSADSLYGTQDDGAACLQVGIADPAALRLVHGVDARTIEKRSHVLRRRRLSVFGDGLQFLIGTSLSDHFLVRPGTLATASVDAVEDVEGIPGALRFTGWTYDPATGAAADKILLVDSRRRIVGLGRRHMERPDVAKPGMGIDLQVGWRAWGRIDMESNRPYLFATFADGTATRIADGRAPASEPGRVFSPGARVAPLLSVEARGDWLRFGDQPGLPGGLDVGIVLTTWNGADQCTGTLRAVLAVPAGVRALEVPFTTGPDATGSSLRLLDARAERELAYLVVPTQAQECWNVWRVDLARGEERPTLLVLDVEDRGSGFGQWVGLGEPRWIP